MPHTSRALRQLVPAALAATLLCTSLAAAAPARVLWWDASQEFGGSAQNALREAMSDFLSDFNGGTVFVSTYVDGSTPGGLAAELAANDYDVVVLDVTRLDGDPSVFNPADLTALGDFYATHKNLVLDGLLYIRSIIFNATTVFPGPNGATGAFTANEVFQLANRGGGVLIGTDHDGYQAEANGLLQALVPLASFRALPSRRSTDSSTAMIC